MRSSAVGIDFGTTNSSIARVDPSSADSTRIELARFPLLGWADKRAIGRAMLKIARSGGRPQDASSSADGMTMLAWLQRQHQTDRAIRRIDDVLIVHRSAGLDHGRRSCLARLLHAVGKRKERV